MARAASSSRRRRRRARRGRRTSQASAILLTAVVAAPLLVGGGILLAEAATPDACRTHAEVRAGLGYSDEQLAHAQTIIAAGRDLGLGERDQTIAVMTAAGESSLRNLDYGDWETARVTNPDGSRTTSIGLFQQQDGWGTRDERLDPHTAATLFYRTLIARVPDRDALPPTQVAHRTQVNLDPEHYERYWDDAVAIVDWATAPPGTLHCD